MSGGTQKPGGGQNAKPVKPTKPTNKPKRA